MGSTKWGGGWKSASAEGPRQAGISPRILQYVSDSSSVWSLTLQPPAAAALTASFSDIRCMAEVTKPRRLPPPKERCFPHRQYCLECDWLA